MYFAVIDIETTGGKPSQEKITEIGIVKHDGTKEIDRYHTLINPNKQIPPFIVQLTGIDDAMVSDAPQFYEVAKDIVEFTQDCYFVAHNVAFDYGFIQHEFKELGYHYNRKRFCTVKLSRKLLPGHKSYSLGKLCKSLGINLANHHRALDDALAASKILELLFKEDGFMEYVRSPREKLLAQTNMSQDLIDKLESFPETTGVYYFKNAHNEIIYVGKSNAIRKRIFTHMYNDKTRKAIVMKEEVTDFDYVETHSEMVALLLENEEIKKLQPKHNRALKRKQFTHGLIVRENQSGFRKLEVVKMTNKVVPIIAFANKYLAMGRMERLERKYRLCQVVNTYPERSNLCLTCEGACRGQESAEQYNLKVDEAVQSLSFGNQNMIIVEKVKHGNYLVFIKNGHYAGFRFVDEATDLEDPMTMLEDQQEVFDKDAFFILNHFLNLSPSPKRKVMVLDQAKF